MIKSKSLLRKKAAELRAAFESLDPPPSEEVEGFLIKAYLRAIIYRSPGSKLLPTDLKGIRRCGRETLSPIDRCFLTVVHWYGRLGLIEPSGRIVPAPFWGRYA